MRKMVLVFLVSMLLGLSGVTVARASEVDVLLQKLVEKGILTSSEAQAVRSETNEEITKQEKQKQEEYKETSKSILPDWVKNTKLTGDFRLRYEYKRDKGTEVATNRPRFRLRAGLEDQVNDKVKVGFMLATGVSDTSSGGIRSNNQTMTGFFNKKPVILDKAFVEYTPKKWVTLIGGKMANPIWEPMSLVWDPDITPEGGAVKLNGKLNSLDLFANLGALTINDVGSGDPYIGFIQPGAEWHATNDMSVKTAVALYGYANVKGKSYFTLTNYTGTNSGTTGFGTGNYLYNYDAVNPTLEFNFDRLLEKLDNFGIHVPSFLDVPYVSLFGSFLHNVNGVKEPNAYIAGLKVGDKKISKFGDWQFSYAYKVLERDSILDILPDDDFYSGKTNTRGNEYFFEYGLSKNTSLKLNYYHTWKIGADKAAQVPEDHFMLDFNFKF